MNYLTIVSVRNGRSYAGVITVVSVRCSRWVRSSSIHTLEGRMCRVSETPVLFCSAVSGRTYYFVIKFPAIDCYWELKNRNWWIPDSLLIKLMNWEVVCFYLQTSYQTFWKFLDFENRANNAWQETVNSVDKGIFLDSIINVDRLLWYRVDWWLERSAEPNCNLLSSRNKRPCQLASIVQYNICVT